LLGDLVLRLRQGRLHQLADDRFWRNAVESKLLGEGGSCPNADIGFQVQYPHLITCAFKIMPDEFVIVG
jgi:hypothetical protein